MFSRSVSDGQSNFSQHCDKQRLRPCSAKLFIPLQFYDILTAHKTWVSIIGTVINAFILCSSVSNLFSIAWNILQTINCCIYWGTFFVLCVTILSSFISLVFAYNIMCILKTIQCWQRYKRPIITGCFCWGFFSFRWSCQPLKTLRNIHWRGCRR